MRVKRIFIPQLTAPVVGKRLDNSALYDSFAGGGAITAHVPEKKTGGAAWLIRTVSFANLTGGYVQASANNAVATISCGLQAFELTSSVMVNATGYTAGLAWRHDGTNHYWLKIDAQANLLTVQCTNYGQAIFTKSLAITRGQYYSYRILTFGNFHRLFVDGAYQNEGFDKSTTLAGTEVGLRADARNGPARWDWIRVRPIAYKVMTVIGDSISLVGVTYWPALVCRTWNGGLMLQKNHAVGGQTIMANMDAQVVASASDAAALIICNLGTNDSDVAGITAEYEENLTELQGSNPGATIIAMGIMPRADPGDNSRTSKNTKIATAAANAGCTYWNTDGWIDPAVDCDDGLHPNAQGHEKIKAEILARI